MFKFAKTYNTYEWDRGASGLSFNFLLANKQGKGLWLYLATHTRHAWYFGHYFGERALYEYNDFLGMPRK